MDPEQRRLRRQARRDQAWAAMHHRRDAIREMQQLHEKHFEQDGCRSAGLVSLCLSVVLQELCEREVDDADARLDAANERLEVAKRVEAAVAARLRKLGMEVRDDDDSGD